MTEMRLLDCFGPICVDPADGTKLYERIHDALARGETVRLDVHGVTTLAGAFLTTAVGSLYVHFAKEDLDKRLLWQGLDATDAAVMRLVERNAIRFYSATRPQQEALLLSAANRVAQE